ncbi:MAG: ribonuclease E/G [Rhodospirillaceae bacterium]|nr:ribonuclease E/G [Rhodospirillaceae bacterium]
MTRKPNRIFVSRGPGETRAALVADERVIEIVHVRDAEAQTGAVYAGRVIDRVPNADALFVEIGVGPPGVLDAKDQNLAKGRMVAVEVATPARAEKGHKLKPSKAAIPEAMKTPGLITAAPDAAAGWWCRYKEHIVEIVAEQAAQRQRLAGLLGAAAPIVDAAANDMTFAEIDEQVDAALASVVVLPSGGRLVIEQTAALVAIDIDAGASSIVQTNTEAMTELARQIRLRNLAGHIVVDLIHTKGPQRFVAALKEACADDPAETRIMGLTPSGMIDIVRRRVRPSLAEALYGPHTVAYRALRLACRELVGRRVAKVELRVAPTVAAALNEQLNAAMLEARDTAKGEIVVVPQASFAEARIEVGA